MNEKLMNNLKGILSIICVACTLVLFSFIISKSVNTEIIVRTEKVSLLKNDDFIETVLNNISNNDINSAKYNFSENSKYIKNKEVVSYFENFFSFIEANNTQKNILESENFDFIAASNYIENYFKSQKSYNEMKSFMISEIVPYYIAEKIVQKNINKKNIDNCLSFLKKYINHFSQFDSLSQCTADVICFYYYLQYENANFIQKDDKKRLKSFINEIDSLQQRHLNELGKNGTYKKQSQYLDKIHIFFNDKQNSLIGRHPTQLKKIGTRFEKIEVYRF